MAYKPHATPEEFMRRYKAGEFNSYRECRKCGDVTDIVAN